jgi:hypothetical protein
MEKGIFLNRYGDNILFERIDLLKFRISGFHSYGIRRMTDSNDLLCGIDPSGGPYIENNIHGMSTNMGQFNKKWKYLNVETIQSDGDTINIILTCTYSKEIKWKTIKNPA